jgi:hypothetical protein
MIFGFNTEIESGGTTYHVQSEPRQKDLLLQTQVFVHGRCVGKRAASYAGRVEQGNFSDEDMHELLKVQHRLVVDAIRDGRLDEVLREADAIQDVDGEGLVLNWLNPESGVSDLVAVMRFQVTDSGMPAPGANIAVPTQPSLVTNPDGTAEMRFTIRNPQAREMAVTVCATYRGKSATRKFRLKLT